VVGQLATLRGRGAAGVATLLDAPLQGAGVGGVERGALHRQQVVIDRLLHQRMPKHVGPGGLVDHQRMVADRLTQQPDELLGVLADHRGQQLVIHPDAGHRGRLQHVLGRLGERFGAGQGAQRLDHRGVGQHALGDVQAATTQRHHTRLGCVVGQLGDQAGLADAGLARHHHDGGLAAGRPLQHRPQLGELAITAHQHRAGDTPDHAVDHRRSDPFPGGVLRR
jgi:hypothetical protein